MKKLVLLLFILILGCSAEEGCEPTPSLVTNDATDITDVSATISGTITPPTCEETVTSQGFVFGESNLPTVEDNRIIKSGNNISHSLSNLKQNTTYYVRTFFENPTGVYYGNEVIFTTTRKTTWIKTFDEAENGFVVGRSGQQTTDGGYIVAGDIQYCRNGSRDVYLVKTDVNGDEQWSKTYGGGDAGQTGYIRGYSVQQTTDGGYIVAGDKQTGETGGDRDGYVLKTDINGNEQWSKTLGGGNFDEANSVQQTTDGGFIIAGYTSSFTSQNVGASVYLVKTDINGNEQWSKTYGEGVAGQYMDYEGFSVQQTTDGGYLIAGSKKQWDGSPEDVYLVKTDINGDEQWSKTFGGGKARGRSVQQTTDGGFIIAGTTYSSIIAADSSSFYLVKTDINGNEQWSKTYGEGVADQSIYYRGTSVQQTTDGGYIIAGAKRYYTTQVEDVYLVKADINGNEQWSKTYYVGGVYDPYSVQQTTDGGFIIAGSTASLTSQNCYDYEIWVSSVILIKTDVNGDVNP